jgi:hypothetical protein
MTKRAPCSIMMATLSCLLAVAASASAECAWVLWNEVYALDKAGKESTRYHLVAAFETKNACESSPQLFFPVPVVRDYDNKTGAHEKLLSRCLPDTLDPRGPKGK